MLHNDLEFIGWGLLVRAQGSELKPLVENLTRVSAESMCNKLFLLAHTIFPGKNSQKLKDPDAQPHFTERQLVTYLGPIPACMRLFPKP